MLCQKPNVTFDSLKVEAQMVERASQRSLIFMIRSGPIKTDPEQNITTT